MQQENTSQWHRDLFAANLQRVLQIRKRTQSDIVQALGITSSTVSDWANGKKYPRVDKMQRLADFLGVEIEELRDEPKKEAKPKPKAVKIPVLGRVQAGIPVEAVEEILDHEEITPELAATGEFFGLQIRGDSMESRLVEGDVVIVRKQPDAETGNTVVVMINGDDACVKRLKKHEDGSLSLISSNPCYDPLFYSRGEVRRLPVTLLGRVVELRGKL